MPEYRSYGDLDDRIANDGDRGFTGFNNRLRPDQLQPGTLADAQSIRLDRNGEAQVRKGVDLLIAPLVVGTDALTLPFNLPTLAQEGDGTTAILDDDAVNAIYGSCAYSDPTAQESQYIIIAANTKAIAINVSDGTTTDINYDTGLIVSDSVDMIQALNKVFIFRDGQTALEWNGDLSGTPLFTEVASGEYTQPVQIVCSPGEFAILENRGVVHQQDGVQVGSVIEVLSAKTLDTEQTSGLREGAKFTVAKVFTQESSYQSITNANSSNTNLNPEYTGMHRVTCELAGHGYKVGDPIDVTGFGTNNVANGNQFVAEKTDDEFIYYVDGNPSLSDAPSGEVRLAHGFEFYIGSDGYDGRVRDGLTLQSTPILTREVSVGLGFTHMPAPPFAIYHQRRLVMPFNYTVNDTEGSFTRKDSSDEVIASDILDSDTYDQIYAQYRFNAGTADFVVGLHSFAEDTLLVFNRNSIHAVKNSSDVANASVQLLTNEVGCLARKSIVQVGNRVIFLSDNGVYSTEFIDEYNLRGTGTPMSESIDSTIKRINKGHAEKAVAVYFNNRYYIAVPLDESTENNAVLVFNFLNNQWESIDQVNDPNFLITNLLVVGEGSNRGVYATNEIGGVHKLESREDGFDRVVTQIGGSEKTLVPPASVSTRQYTLGTMQRKKWKEFDFHIQSSDDRESDLSFSAETENPDANLELGTLSSFNLRRVQESVTLAGFSDSDANGTYTFTEELDLGAPVYVYNKGSRSLHWVPSAPILQVKNESGSDIYYGFSPSTSPALVDGSFIDATNGNPVSGSSTYTQGGDAVPTNLAAGEDVSIRGRIGNKRGYGIQFTFNNVTGRPRIRAVEAKGSIAMRSIDKAI